MLWTLLVAFAENPEEDVRVARMIDGTPTEIAPMFEDTLSIEKLLPERCAFAWVHGDHPYGPASLMYNIKSFQRRLTVTLAVEKPLRRIAMDHQGRKGFITEFKLEPRGEQTRVQITTYLNAPGWPMRRYYFNTVQPKWRRCYEQMLDGVEARLEEERAPG